MAPHKRFLYISLFLPTVSVLWVLSILLRKLSVHRLLMHQLSVTPKCEGGRWALHQDQDLDFYRPPALSRFPRRSPNPLQVVLA